MERSKRMMESISRELTAPNTLSIESSMDGCLPSPVAEITAQRATEDAKGLAAGKGRKSRVRRPTTVARARRRRSKRRQLSPSEVIVGILAGINDSGQPLVRHPLDPSGRIMLARTTVPVSLGQVDREVVIAFESGDIERPIVLGVVWRPEERFAGTPGRQPAAPRVHIEATVDGDKLMFTAEREIRLQCGEACITLTKAGKIILRGTYLLCRSSGPNCIKGASVHIN